MQGRGYLAMTEANYVALGFPDDINPVGRDFLQIQAIQPAPSLVFVSDPFHTHFERLLEAERP
jgi:hypothetical protein